MVLVVAALPGAKIGDVLDEPDRGDPFHHFEAQLDRATGRRQGTRLSMQHAAGVAQAAWPFATQGVRINARDLRRDVGTKAHLPARLRVDDLEGAQIQVLARAGLSGEVEQQLFDALQRKAIDEVIALTEGVPADLAEMLRALVNLCGGREVLVAARERLAKAPAPVLAALDDVLAIAERLSARFPELPLYFDLGELRGYHYHTGVVFAVFVPGVGQAIAQGGRYDDIGADFGRARPATGFSTDLKTLVTLGRAEVELPSGGIWMPDSTDAALWQQVCQLRSEGQHVRSADQRSCLCPHHPIGCPGLRHSYP